MQEFHLVSSSTNSTKIVPISGVYEYEATIGGDYIYDHSVKTNGILNNDNATFHKSVTCVITLNTLTFEYLPTQQKQTVMAEGLSGTATTCV